MKDHDSVGPPVHSAIPLWVTPHRAAFAVGGFVLVCIGLGLDAFATGFFSLAAVTTTFAGAGVFLVVVALGATPSSAAAPAAPATGSSTPLAGSNKAPVSLGAASLYDSVADTGSTALHSAGHPLPLEGSDGFRSVAATSAAEASLVSSRGAGVQSQPQPYHRSHVSHRSHVQHHQQQQQQQHQQAPPQPLSSIVTSSSSSVTTASSLPSPAPAAPAAAATTAAPSPRSPQRTQLSPQREAAARKLKGLLDELERGAANNERLMGRVTDMIGQRQRQLHDASAAAAAARTPSTGRRTARRRARSGGRHRTPGGVRSPSPVAAWAPPGSPPAGGGGGASQQQQAARRDFRTISPPRPPAGAAAQQHSRLLPTQAVPAVAAPPAAVAAAAGMRFNPFVASAPPAAAFRPSALYPNE